MSPLATRALAFAGATLSAATGIAQDVPERPAAETAFYRDVTATRLPAGLAGRCMNAAAGDADGDGDLDLALAMEFHPNILLLNDGAGVFADVSEARLPRTAHDSEDVAFADFDRDGDLDLVLVSEDDRTDELYVNDGAGRFTDASARLATDDVSNALVVLDLDRDGSPDVLTGNIGTDRVLLSDGRGRFRDATAERWPQDGVSRTQDLEAADVDGDGDLDVLVGNEGQNQLFLNEDGRLMDATARSLPARNDETREIKAADVDGDGDLDLVVANVRFVMDQVAQDYLLLNDGTGVFSTAEPARFPEDARSNFATQVVDLDQDGDLDVLAPSTVFARGGSGSYLTLLNDGSGRFAAARSGTVLPAGTEGNGFDVEVADFDGDGIDDLFLCNRASFDAFADSGGLQRLLLGMRVRE
jgi:hypothetical protein